jgi:hypothetical protein
LKSPVFKTGLFCTCSTGSCLCSTCVLLPAARDMNKISMGNHSCLIVDFTVKVVEISPVACCLMSSCSRSKSDSGRRSNKFSCKARSISGIAPRNFVCHEFEKTEQKVNTEADPGLRQYCIFGCSPKWFNLQLLLYPFGKKARSATSESSSFKALVRN